MEKQRLQDELDNLKLFVLPEVEGRLADVLAMQEDDPDWEYREQDVQQACEELADVRSRIANIEAHLTQRAPDAGDSASFLNMFYPIFNLLNQVRRDPPQRR